MARCAFKNVSEDIHSCWRFLGKRLHLNRAKSFYLVWAIIYTRRALSALTMVHPLQKQYSLLMGESFGELIPPLCQDLQLTSRNVVNGTEVGVFG
jgi:hypothetical protein